MEKEWFKKGFVVDLGKFSLFRLDDAWKKVLNEKPKRWLSCGMRCLKGQGELDGKVAKCH